MNIKQIKYFELTKLECSINYARIKATRHKKKTGETIRIKSIKGIPYAWKPFEDLKDITEHEKHSILKEMSDYLDLRKIIESDEDIL